MSGFARRGSGAVGSRAEASCIIVAFHRADTLRRLLERLGDPRLEIIVVNVEDDTDIALIAGDRAVPFAANAGYAAAVNFGARLASCPFTIFMNDDLEASSEHVLRLVSHLRSGRVDVAVPMVTNITGGIEPTVTLRATGWRHLLEAVFPAWETWRRPRSTQFITSAWAVLVATRTALLRKMPLDETYWMYSEDVDWFDRLQRDGKLAIVDVSVRIRHLGGQGAVRADKSSLQARNAVRRVRKTRGRLAAARSWPIVVLWNLRLWLTSLLIGAATDVIGARRAGVHAALRAWREV